MGTPEFAIPTLKKLIEIHDVSCVISQPDRRSGRKYKLKCTPVKEIAVEKNIPVYQPESLRNEEILDTLEKYNPELIVVAAYGQILPKYILDYPKFGCINVHGSILPKYRGSAPIQWALINGEPETGVTIMRMDTGTDTGDILAISKVKINPNDTSGILFEKLSYLGADLLINTIRKLKDDEINFIKQDQNKATYAPMITKEMCKVDFSKSALEIHNLIRGLNPKPASYATIKDDNKTINIKILSSELPETENKLDVQVQPGSIVKILPGRGILVSTINNESIIIKKIIPENNKKMTADSFFINRKVDFFEI